MLPEKNRGILALALCFALCIGLLVGCTQATTTTPSTKASGTTTASQATTTTAEDLYFNRTGYPIVDDQIELTVKMFYISTRGTHPEQNDAWAFLQELTNIKFIFDATEQSSWTEVKNLALASGDIGDVWWNGLNADDLIAQARTGNFIDMKDYIYEYAPAVTQLMESNADVKNAMVMTDGSIRSFPWTNIEISRGHGKCPSEYVAVNTKWLKTLGLEMPTTTQELYDVMYAFRNEDPNGNGLKDEIPLAPRYGLPNLKHSLAWFGKMFGTYNCFDNDGVIEYVPFTEEYKDWLIYLNAVYENELIDPEIFTMGVAEVRAKGEQEVYGVVLSSGAFTVVGQDKADDFYMAPPMKAPNGDQIGFNRQYASVGYFAITKNCQYIEAAVRFADLFYTDEYVTLNWMGMEDDAWKYNADGTIDWIYTDKLKTTEEVRAAKGLQTSGNGPGMAPPEWFLLNDPVEGPLNAQRKWMAENYGDYLRLPMPFMYFESSVQKQLSDINADITGYQEESLANFVMGRLSIEAEYDNYIAKLKSMGADKIIELVQQTYDTNFK